MAKAPVVTELPLQNVRFLFGTMVELRMLPQVLEQTGRAEVGEFKLVAHFPEQEKASGNEAAYLARHKGFRGGDYNTYHGDPYTLDEINWDATGRAGVHLVTKTKYGQVVEFPTIPDKNDTSELMLIVSEYVESIKTPPLIVRCSGIGGTISPLGNKKYALSLTTGATKCPTSIKDHVPKKYHAEDMDIIPHVGGANIFSAESLSPTQRDFIGQQIARQMQGYYRTGVIGVDPVIGAYPNGPMSIAKRTPEAKQDFFREPAVQDEDGFWNKGPNRWQAHKIAKGVAYDQLERAQSRGLMAEDYAAESLLLCSEHDDYFNACGCGTKTMNAPYAGRGSLMDIGKDTGLGSFTPGELTTSSAIHGDFDQASLNYSGHQNLEVRGAEYFAAASTATPNLKREKANLRAAIREEIDPKFEYSQCVWGPYALRMEGANTNKFYMVFVYDNGNGVFRALGGYGGLAQNPRLFDVMTTRDQAAAVAAATRKLKAKERKGYFTYRSEEGNAPIQDPMEFGEMANWTPMDGTPGLSKRKRAESSFMTPDLLWENLGGYWKAIGINPEYDMGQPQGQPSGGNAGAGTGNGGNGGNGGNAGTGGESEGQAQQEQEQHQEGHRGHEDSQPISPYAADFEYHYNFSEKYDGDEVLDALRKSNSSTKAEAIDWLIDKGFLHSDEQYNAAYVLALGDALGLRDEEMDAEENRQPPWSATNPRPNRRIECGECDARGFIAGKECTKCDGAGYWNIHSPRCATCETDIQGTDGAECDECDEWYCDNHLTEDGECKVCGNTSLSFHSEDIPVWNDGIVEWETSGPMSPTGSGYSSASAPPTGVIAGPGDTFLNYTEAQNYLVETSGGLWGAEHFEAMARIDPKNAQDVKKVTAALKQRYKGIKINRIEYITNRKGSSNKYHVFAFTNRGVFNGYGRIGKTMTIFGPMSATEGQKKMDTKMRRGGYKEQV